MKRKFLILIFTLNLFSLIGCFEHCKDFEFFDYKNIKVAVENPIVIEDDSLSFGVNYYDTEYLSSIKRNLNFGAKLYASIKCDKGYGGDKFPINRIKITSDSDFNATFPANSELNEIVSVRGKNLNGNYVLGKVNDFIPSQINLGYMFLSLRPENNGNHKFTIEIEKSNGEILSATSEEVFWE